MPTSVYIHIPFCLRKCNYCSFTSYPKLNLKKEYIKSLCKEISSKYKKEKLKTIYIGGGTPSLLSSQEIREILSYFDFDRDTEITCEANPESTTKKWLSEIYEAGINRLSFGVQSFDNNLLKLIGRKHSIEQALEVIKEAKFFQNINIDLIYGLPNQTMKIFEETVIKACKISPQHISSYGLKIEEGCNFYKNRPQNLPNDDLQADMYQRLCEITKEYGYQHYEISNFSKQGYESKHNLNYWEGKEYYGFGCGASGYENNIRYTHTNSIEQYIKNPFFMQEEEKLTTQMKLEEKIFLGLRKSSGINIEEINQEFQIDFEEKYKSILAKYKDYFIRTDNNYALSNQGFLISNYILSDFIE
jgi:oxygen-independent coproporphyrinogen-3 oxidase